jgi:hypothetical protein
VVCFNWSIPVRSDLHSGALDLMGPGRLRSPRTSSVSGLFSAFGSDGRRQRGEGSPGKHTDGEVRQI